MVPILLLVALLVLLGRMHIDLATGYTAPRLVLDNQGGFVFYDGGARDEGFFYRRVQNQSKDFGKRHYVKGVLAGAALTPDRVVTLYKGRKDAEWFYSVTRRKTLERVWNGSFSAPDLRIDHPRHVAVLGSHVYAFGTDSKGTLRTARLDAANVMKPIAGDPELPQAAFMTDKKGVKKGSAVEPPLLFASATDGKTLTLFWRVGKEKRSSGTPPAELRWTTFDGKTFGPMKTFPVDLAAMSANYARGQLRVYGVLHGTRDDKIRVYTPEKDSFTETSTITYKREGLTGGAGAVALASGDANGREFLFAQIGAAIRYCIFEENAWSEWKDVARRPLEQTAVVYGWFASLLFLSGLLIYHGFLAMKRPPVGPPALPVRIPSEAPPELTEVATIAERSLAFFIDLGIILTGWLFVGLLLPDLFAPDVLVEPRARLVLLAWFMVILLAYFIVFEALFARTPGKRIVGLEVQDLEGGPPDLAATLYRNLFRIELLILPLWIVPALSLVVMFLNPHHQRPGDLVARTAVRRTRTEGAPAIASAVKE